MHYRYENTKNANVHVASTCDYETSVFYMYDEFEVFGMSMFKESEQYLWVLR